MNLKVCLLPYRRSASGIAAYTVEIAKALALSNVKVFLASFGLTHVQKRRLVKNKVNVMEIDPRDPVEYELLGGPLPANISLSRKLHNTLELGGLLKSVDLLHFTLAPAAFSFDHQNKIVMNAWNPLNFIKDMEKNFRSFGFPWNFLAGLGTIEGRIADDLAFRKARKIVCNITDVFNWMKKKYPSKVVHIPPPINVANPLHNKNKENPITVLCVVRDLEMPRKNISTLLRTMIILARKGITNLRILLVGRYSKKFRYIAERIAKDTGIDIELVQFAPREELSEIYASSDIFVFPSFYEELGYALLEAMSYGLPVVASDIPAFRDLTENGRNGFLVPPNDPMQWALALQKLIEDDDLRIRLGDESLNMTQNKHSYKSVSRKLIKLYTNILESQ